MTQADARLRPIPWPLACARQTARLGLLLLGGLAAWRVFHEPYVREFQAGPPSGLWERLSAVTIAAAIEALGFGALILWLALMALPLAKLCFPGRPASRARSGTLAILAAGFALWAVRGTYFAGEWLPFLAPGELVLLNLFGFLAACLPALALASWRARAAPRLDAAAIGCSAGVFSLGGGLAALWRLTANPDGPTAPQALVEAGACLVLAIALAWWLPALWPAPQEPSGTRPGRSPSAFARALDLMGLALTLAALVLSLTQQGPLVEPEPASRDQATVSKAALEASDQQPNLVFVVVDTLRADALSCYGYPRPTSPHLDAFAEQGALFEDAVASAAWTKPTTGTLLTGLYPSRHGALHHGSKLRVPEGGHTLAEAFQQAGWYTAAFVTNPNIQAIFDFDRGFDSYFDAPVVDTLPKAALRGTWFGRLLIALTRYQFNWNYQNDNRELNRRALPWLREHAEQRFALYLHYIDPHSPYAPPARLRRAFHQNHGLVFHNQRKALAGRDLYDGEVAYQDEGLGALFEELRRLDLDRRTLVVVTADHGEEWFEFGSLGHGQSLSQPLIHVPLILRGPGVPAGVRVSAPVEIVDLAATLLELCGLPQPEGRFGDGHSLAGLLEDTQASPSEPIFLENEFGMEQEQDDNFVLTGVRAGPLKLVLTEKSLYRSQAGEDLPAYELFDLSTDPGERENRFEEAGLRKQRDRLLGELEQHARFLTEQGFRDQPPGMLSEDIKRQLEALGYAVGR